jgi:hypothetical protein
VTLNVNFLFFYYFFIFFLPTPNLGVLGGFCPNPSILGDFDTFRSTPKFLYPDKKVEGSEVLTGYSGFGTGIQI